MTIWDDIYKNYQQGGQAWATLAEEIHPLFQDFLEKTNFSRKHVLDIGCGTGKYLQFLRAGGFITDGIDSSETAIAMSTQVLPAKSVLVCADMFTWEIPTDTYDVIISVAAIHHGTKPQIQALVDRIHNALLEGGRIFITVPDFASSKKWNTFKDHEEIAEGTFAPLAGPEKGLPHSFYTQEQVRQLFAAFHDLQLDLDTHGRWVVRASK